MRRDHGASALTANKDYRRLLRLVPGVQVGLLVAVVAGLAGAVLLIAQTLVLSWIVRDVLFRRETLSDVAPLLILAGGAAVGRTALITLREAMSRFTAIRAKTQLRERLTAHLLRLGTAYASGARTGDLVVAATEGIEKLDAFVSRYLPQRALGIGVPLLIVLAIVPVDPLSAGLLLFTVPVILMLMALIGTFTLVALCPAGGVDLARLRPRPCASAHLLGVLPVQRKAQARGRVALLKQPGTVEIIRRIFMYLPSRLVYGVYATSPCCGLEDKIITPPPAREHHENHPARPEKRLRIPQDCELGFIDLPLLLSYALARHQPAH